MDVFDGIAELISETFEELELGVEVTIRRVIVGEYDPDLGARPRSEPTFTVLAPVGTLRKEIDPRVSVAACDMSVTIPAAGLEVTPELTDKVEFGGSSYAILAKATERGGNHVLVHLLHCRRT